MIRSGTFLPFFCLKPGAERISFGSSLAPPPYLREGISDALAQGLIILVLTGMYVCMYDNASFDRGGFLRVIIYDWFLFGPQRLRFPPP